MIRTEFFIANERWHVQYFNRNRNTNEYFEQKHQGLRTLIADVHGRVNTCRWEKKTHMLDRPLDLHLPIHTYTSRAEPSLVVLFDVTNTNRSEEKPKLFRLKSEQPYCSRGKLIPDLYECDLEELFLFLCEKQGIRTNNYNDNSQNEVYERIDYGFDEKQNDPKNRIENSLFYAEVRDPHREYNREKHTAFLLAPNLSLTGSKKKRLIIVQSHHVICFRPHVQYIPIEFPFAGLEYNYFPFQNTFLEVNMTQPLTLPFNANALKNKYKQDYPQLLFSLLKNNNYQLCLVEQFLVFTNHYQIIESMTRPVSSDVSLEYLTKQSLMPLYTWNSIQHINKAYENKPSGCFPWDSFSKLILRKMYCTPTLGVGTLGDRAYLERLQLCFRLQNTLDFLTDLITLVDNNAGEMRIEFEKQMLEGKTCSNRLDIFLAKHIDPLLNRLLPFLTARQIQTFEMDIEQNKLEIKMMNSIGLNLARFAITLLIKLSQAQEVSTNNYTAWLKLDQHQRISSLRLVCMLKCLEFVNENVELVFFLTPNYENSCTADTISPTHELTAIPFDTKTRKFVNSTYTKLRNNNNTENRLVVRCNTDNVECYRRIPSRKSITNKKNTTTGLKLNAIQLPLNAVLHTTENRLTRRTSLNMIKILTPKENDESNMYLRHRLTREKLPLPVDVLITPAKKIDPNKKHDTNEHLSLFDPLAGIRSMGNINKLIEEIRGTIVSNSTDTSYMFWTSPKATKRTVERVKKQLVRQHSIMQEYVRQNLICPENGIAFTDDNSKNLAFTTKAKECTNAQSSNVQCANVQSSNVQSSNLQFSNFTRKDNNITESQRIGKVSSNARNGSLTILDTTEDKQTKTGENYKTKTIEDYRSRSSNDILERNLENEIRDTISADESSLQKIGERLAKHNSNEYDLYGEAQTENNSDLESVIYDYSRQFYSPEHKLVNEKRLFEMKELIRMREDYFDADDESDDEPQSRIKRGNRIKDKNIKRSNWVACKQKMIAHSGEFKPSKENQVNEPTQRETSRSPTRKWISRRTSRTHSPPQSTSQKYIPLQPNRTRSPPPLQWKSQRLVRSPRRPSPPKKVFQPVFTRQAKLEETSTFSNSCDTTSSEDVWQLAERSERQVRKQTPRQTPSRFQKQEDTKSNGKQNDVIIGKRNDVIRFHSPDSDHQHKTGGIIRPGTPFHRPQNQTNNTVSQQSPKRHHNIHESKIQQEVKKPEGKKHLAITQVQLDSDNYEITIHDYDQEEIVDNITRDKTSDKEYNKSKTNTEVVSRLNEARDNLNDARGKLHEALDNGSIDSLRSQSVEAKEDTWYTMKKLHKEVINSLSYIHKMFQVEISCINAESASSSEKEFLKLVEQFNFYYKKLINTDIKCSCDENTRHKLMDASNEYTHQLLDKILAISDNLLFESRYTTYYQLNLLISSLSHTLEKHGSDESTFI